MIQLNLYPKYVYKGLFGESRYDYCKLTVKNMLVSTPYNQHFFNLPIISKTNTKVSKFMHSNIVDW